ncbi:universal stress protein [Halopelagius longus]|uniref:Universal stress protein n=1 Tax=Halopelagius longus TaxID=1236180 RepID=A0A1H1BC80_9EURY|nr:universal stress protein [Halopelagius longus]RDI70728.1 universal stress protein [Halopelagius longus]SDQ49470.1 Nucleotide-binding universal stress protein, UspA family [Halopelagius longus]
MSANTADRTDATGLDTVLLGIGGRDDARVDALVDAVRETAGPTDATVVVAHVFDKESYRDAVEQLLDAEGGTIEPDELASRMSLTREIIERLERDGIDCEPRATTGTSGEGIVEIAEEVGADRVVVGGRQRSPAGKAIFGSVAQEVMLEAPCPVTFVRNRE